MRFLPHIKIALVALFIASFASLAPKAQAADPSLTLSPSANTTYVGQSFDVEVQLASDSNQHSETTYEIQFDPSVLQVSSNNQGFFHYNYYNGNIDNTLGTVSLTGDFYGGSNDQSGTMATITFTAIASGTDTLLFTANTQILDEFSAAYLAPVFNSASVTTNVALTESTLSISSSFTDWALDDVQEVIVSIDTQGNSVAGTDIVLTYDPALFQFNSMLWKNLFPNQQGFSVDGTNGIITISGVSEQSNPFNGSGEVVGFTFKSLALGIADFDFDWTAGVTTDTNIVDSANLNADLLVAAPTPLAINVINSATLSLQFGLLDYLGDITTKSGSLEVMSEGVLSSFSNPSVAGVITDHPLGTFTYGLSYDLALRVPGYLATKQNQTINFGVNPVSGVLDFGNLTPGDVNQDDVNNTFDLYQIFNNWNGGVSSVADLNGDGKVNTFDVSLLYAYYNQTAAL